MMGGEGVQNSCILKWPNQKAKFQDLWILREKLHESIPLHDFQVIFENAKGIMFTKPWTSLVLCMVQGGGHLGA